MRIEKIYSRKKIRIINKKVNKFKLFAFLSVLFLIFVVVNFLIMAYPTLKSNCETAAGAKANRIIHNVTEEVMANHNYDEFAKVKENENGEVSYIEMNTTNLNYVVIEIINKIQEQLDSAPTTTIYINYGSISGITLLKNIGPKFNIELESAGNVNYDIKSEFEDAGINQTIHRIYVEINTCVGILTPVGCFENEVNGKVLLSEGIIIGDVPKVKFD